MGQSACAPQQPTRREGGRQGNVLERSERRIHRERFAQRLRASIADLVVDKAVHGTSDGSVSRCAAASFTDYFLVSLLGLSRAVTDEL